MIVKMPSVEKLKNPKVLIVLGVVLMGLLIPGIAFAFFYNPGVKVTYGTKTVCTACRQIITNKTKTKYVDESGVARYSISTKETRSSSSRVD